MRRAFTIVELLVVVTVIAILVALLLPALSSGRESARLTQCRNHLRQIVIAAHHFQDIHRVFPGYGGEILPAGVRLRDGRSRPTSANDDGRFRGDNWMIQIMPFMEESELARQLVRLSKDRVRSDDDVRKAVRVSVSTFHCPSRRDAIAYPLHRRYRSRFGDRGARTDYAINGGSSTASGRFVQVKSDGIWTMGRHMGNRDITDGTSKSYFVGEKAMEADLYTTGTDRGDLAPLAALADQFGAANSYVRYAVRVPQSDSVQNCLACHDFGSSHTGVWNVALCDGSVRAMTFDMELSVHRSFASIAAGDRVEVDIW